VESFGRLAAGDTFLLVEGVGLAAPIPRRPFTFADPPPAGLRVAIGARIERLVLEDAGGTPVTVATMGRSRPLLVSLWATHCAACVAELGDLQALAEAGAHDVVLVSLDPSDRRAAAMTLLDQHGLRANAVFATEALVADLVDVARLPLPTTLIVEDGVLIAAAQDSGAVRRLRRGPR
jgi:thiol-disulfide isomerase/thioredoxin